MDIHVIDNQLDYYCHSISNLSVAPV